MPKTSVFWIALLLFMGATSALVIGPRIYEQDDFGDPIFSEFTYSISADCTASSITLIVMNGSNKPVKGASTYLKYIDFSTPLMGTGVSDKDGIVQFKLPGNVNLMRGLFVMMMEKKEFRSKEVHFDLSPCFTNGTNPSKPPKPPVNNSNNQTPSGNGTQQNGTNQTSQNNTNNANGTDGGASGDNGTGNGSDGNWTDSGNDAGDWAGVGRLCAPAFALPVFLIMFLKQANRKPNSPASRNGTVQTANTTPRNGHA